MKKIAVLIYNYLLGRPDLRKELDRANNLYKESQKLLAEQGSYIVTRDKSIREIEKENKKLKQDLITAAKTVSTKIKEKDSKLMSLMLEVEVLKRKKKVK